TAPPTAPLPPSELLAEAGRWLDSHGWIQGNFYDEKLAACLLGAVNFAARGQYGRDWRARHAAINTATDALAEVATELQGQPLNGSSQAAVIEHNNEWCLGRADAVATLEKASAKLAERGL
ncbi:MAG: DUF6197 family protein, partial [Microbacteriaceae bacterium]